MFRKNLAATLLSATITDPSQTGSDTTNEVTVAAGDRINFRYSTDNTGTGVTDDIRICVEFEPDAERMSGYTGPGANTSVSSTVTWWSRVFGFHFGKKWIGAYGNGLPDLVAVSGALTRYDVWFRTAPGAAKSYTLVLIKNGVVQDGTGGTTDTSLVVTGTATTGTWTGSLAITALDLLVLRSTPSGSPASTIMSFSCAVQASTDGESHVGWFEGQIGHNKYGGPEYQNTTWNLTETLVDAIGGTTPVTFRGIAALLGSGLSTGKSVTFAARKNGATPTSGPIVTLTQPATSGADSSGNEVTIEAGDTWSFLCTTDSASSPTAYVAIVQGPVQECATPFPNESLCGKQQVYAWVAWANGSADGTEDETFFWGDIDLPTTGWSWAPYIEARILEWGNIERSLSDVDGEWEGASFRFTVADTDRIIRDRLANPNTRYFSGGNFAVRMVSDETRRALGNPRTVFAGPPLSSSPETQLRFTFEATDLIGYLLHGESIQIPRRLIDGAHFPNDCPAETYGRPEPIVYGNCSTGSGADVGVVPTIYVGTEVIDGLTWRKMLVCGHAVASIDHWYYTTLGSPPTVEIDDGEGTDYLVPGYAGWIASEVGATPYRDLGTPTRRYTLVYARGPKGDALASGAATLTLDIQGVEDVGDGTGALITDLLLQYKHFFKSFVLQDYQTGDWPTIPLQDWPPNACQMDPEAWATASEVAGGRLVGGYIGASVIGATQQESLREWLKRWNMACDVRLYVNEFFQWAVVMLDSLNHDPALLTDLPHFSDHLDIVEDSFEIDLDFDHLENIIPYAYARDYMADLWGVEAEVRDEDSVTASAGIRAFSAEVQEYWLTRDAATAADVASWRLLRHRYLPQRVTFTVDLCGLDIDLGHLLQVTHFGGIGATGWTRRTLQLERQTLDIEQRLVTLECLDVEGVVQATGSGGSGSGSPG